MSCRSSACVPWSLLLSATPLEGRLPCVTRVRDSVSQKPRRCRPKLAVSWVSDIIMPLRVTFLGLPTPQVCCTTPILPPQLQNQQPPTLHHRLLELPYCTGTAHENPRHTRRHRVVSNPHCSWRLVDGHLDRGFSI